MAKSGRRLDRPGLVFRWLRSPAKKSTVCDKKALQLLGLEGLTDSMRIATRGAIDGAAALLSRLCLPAAEEFGLALRDRISAWRARNAVQMLDQANGIYCSNAPDPADRLNPRLTLFAIEEASWVDDDQIRAMWAGLLASSPSPEGRSDENLLFMSLLKQLSSFQVRVLRFAVERSSKRVTSKGFVLPNPLSYVPIDRFPDLFGTGDVNRIDRELDHLHDLGLIGSIRLEPHIPGGIELDSGLANLTPAPLALHLYIRAQGSRLSPVDYWDLRPAEDEEPVRGRPGGDSEGSRKGMS